MTYKPSKWGLEFHSLPHTEALGAGSVGPGKTYVLRHEPLTQIMVEHARCTGQWDLIGEEGHWLRELAKKHPIRPGRSTGHALYLRRVLSSADQFFNQVMQMAKDIDPGCDVHETKKLVTFTSGYKYQVGQCYNISDYLKYYSLEYTLLLFDELTQFDEEQYDQISSRLRSSDPVLRHLLKNRSMSNPVAMRDPESAGAKVRDVHWVRKRFIDPAPEGRVTLKKTVVLSTGEKRDLTRIYLPAKLWDNPDKEFVREYETRLRGMPEHMRQALLEGDWYVTADSYFASAWNPSIHVCKPFKIPPTWKAFRSMDWGYKSPGVIHWWAMDEQGNLYCTYEYNFKRKLDVEVAKEVKDIEKRLGLWGRKGSLVTGPADTQLWEERGDTGKTKAARFAEHGVPWTKASKSRRSAAERIMHRLLDHDQGTTTPGLVFFSTCRKAIQTLPALPTDPDDMEVPMDGGDDHWFDSVGYACAFASNGRAGIPSIRKESRRRHPLDERSRGSSGYGF